MSFPDIMLSLALVRDGYGEMAISGSLAGPLFCTICGLGLGFIKVTLNAPNHSIPFPIYVSQEKLCLLTLTIMAIHFIMLLIQGEITKYFTQLDTISINLFQ